MPRVVARFLLDCHAEACQGEGSPEMHRSKLPPAGFLNQISWSKISNLQGLPKPPKGSFRAPINSAARI